MRIELLLIGRTESGPMVQLCEEYRSRLSHYCDFRMEEIALPAKQQKLTADRLIGAEGEAILSRAAGDGLLVLLDERGESLSSEAFAKRIGKWAVGGVRRLVFAIGGAHGFSPQVRARADASISLSPMTFTHQMVRPIFLEQLYRAHTILRNEKYHHA